MNILNLVVICALTFCSIHFSLIAKEYREQSEQSNYLVQLSFIKYDKEKYFDKVLPIFQDHYLSKDEYEELYLILK